MMKKILFYAATLFLSGCSYSRDKKTEGSFAETTEKNLAGENHAQKKSNTTERDMRAIIFKNDTIAGSELSGYGYDIYLDSIPYIHQPQVPGISGNTGFSTAAKAEKTGQLIIHKIKNNIMPPSVTSHELDSIGALN